MTIRAAVLCTAIATVAAGCSDGSPYAGGYYEEPAGRTAPPGPPMDGLDADAPTPGDRYAAVGTNPFTRADHDPFSTFAADVDTASYDIFVRDAESGYLPNPASVRLEEYVNSFDYAYPAPEPRAEVPFHIDLAAAQHPFRPELAELRVGIQAASPPDYVQLPTNLVYLIDVSGSMRTSDKLPLAQTVMRHSLDALMPNDTVSIVTYSGSVGVALPPTPVSDRDTIVAVIDGLVADGSTAGGDAMELAYQQAEAAFLEHGFNHIVMCTDGDFNVGISDTDALVTLIEEKRRSGVTLTALGFGSGNLNDEMMERVSNAGNGIYSVITGSAHAERYAREDLLHTAHHVAKDMKIQVEFNPDHVLAYRLLGYENRALADDDFRDDVVDAGEVGAGHRVTALYEVVLTGQSIPDVEGAPTIAEGEPVEGARDVAADELVRVRVRWKDIDAAEEDPAYETAASLAPSDLLDAPSDPDFAWAAAIAAFAEIVKESPYGDPAHLDAIEAIVLAQADRDEDRATFARLFASVRGMIPTP